MVFVNRNDELEGFRTKLWESYEIMRDFYGDIAVPFEDLWLAFIAQYMAIGLKPILIFDRFCWEM